MKFTRIIAVGIIIASVGIGGVAGVGGVDAQTLRAAEPPAEFPPASFKGNQYVDSRGCVYIRAGIDGNVTWVPRISRSRKQLCGYKPTAAGTAVAVAPASPQAKPPVQITVEPTAKAAAAPRPAAPVAKPKPATVAAAPKVTAPKPAARTATTRRTTAPRAAPAPMTTIATTAPAAAIRTKPVAPAPAPVAPAPQRAAAPKPEGGGGCSNASAFSQQFINKPGGQYPVRCGPQAEPPVTVIRRDKQSSLQLAPDTRIVPRHVYDQRQNTTNFDVPPGYKSAWDDDRLNEHRTERTLRPAAVSARATIPAGYRAAWKDNRLNPYRGTATLEGDAQTDRIWTRDLPRTLAPVPTRGQIVRIAAPKSQGGGNGAFWRPRLPDQPQMRQPDQSVMRISTRSASASARTDISGQRR